MPDNAAGNFIDTLSNGDKAILGGSLVVLVSLFLPWYGVDLGQFGSDSVNGFHSWGLLTFIAWLVVVALWLLRGPLSEQFKVPQMGVTDGMIFMIAGAVEAVAALIFWLAYKTDVGTGFGYSAGVKFGTFIALVGGVITALGGYLKQSEPAATVSTGGGLGAAPGGYGAPTPGATPPPPPPSYGAPPAAPPSAPPSSPPPAEGGTPPPPPPAV